MPLPPPGRDSVWPPKDLEAAYKRYNTNATWWAGNPEALSTLYRNQTGGIDLSDVRYRASQFQGGLVGAVSRFFWGTPAPLGELRSKLHLPLASDIATMSADLLFAEPPKITVEDEKTQVRLDEITEDGKLQSKLIEGGEISAALGDVYYVVAWDKEMRDFPWIRSVHGNAVVPKFRGDILTAATIWTVVREDQGHVWRHLERHEKGRVLHGLYVGDSRTLGKLHDLEEVDSLAGLANQDGVTRNPDRTVEVATGIDRLLVEHNPNMLPNRLDPGSPMGRSDYSPGAIQFMDLLDDLWSGFAREFRLAKARAVVTEDALKSAGPGQGAVFDDRELLMPLRLNPNQVTDPVKLIQPLIRAEQYLLGTEAVVKQVVRSCGYSLQSFGEAPGDVAMTATEATQKERLSYLNRGKKTIHTRTALRRSVHTLLLVDELVFGSKIRPEPPKIEFGDTVAESDAVTAGTLNILAQAQAASIETRVRLLHPEWEDDAINREVTAIARENGLGDVPNPEDTVRQATPGMPDTEDTQKEPAWTR